MKNVFYQNNRIIIRKQGSYTNMIRANYKAKYVVKYPIEESEEVSETLAIFTATES